MMRSSVPAFSSTISSAIRRNARSTARASRTVDCLEGMTPEYAKTRLLMKARILWRTTGRRLEHVWARHERRTWIPRPLVITDEELGSGVHQGEEHELRHATD